MATPYLIIDGYNLMHAAGIARRRYGPGDMERCRCRLNRELVSLLSPEVLANAVIVYDAFESVSDENRQQIADGLMVLYAPKGTDADSEIERLLLQHSVPKRVIVVSSDHRLHKAAGRRKAKCVDSEEFWGSLSADQQTESARGSTPATTRAPQEQQSPEVPEADVVNGLQQWAEAEKKLAENDSADANSDTMFDEDYLRELDKDVNDGRIR